VTSLDDMRRHVDELLAPHSRPDLDYAIQIRWDRRVGRARVLRDLDDAVCEIQLAPIRSTVSYATALHEIGHIKGRYQRSRSVMVRERWAWEWARQNALCWTPAMERSATASLAWYAARRGRKDRVAYAINAGVGPDAIP
jgi:hypothetical protein